VRVGWLAGLAVSGLMACARSTSLPRSDASLPDASLPDASLPDASLPDASLPDIESMHAWMVAEALAYCERDQRCDQHYESVEACVLDSENDEAYFQFFGGIGRYEDMSGKYELAPVEVRNACLNVIARAGCADQQSIDDLCENVLVPRNPLPLGASCSDPSSPYKRNFGCAAGLECADVGTPCLTCAAIPPPDPPAVPCTTDSDCAPGYCGATQACRAPPNADDSYVLGSTGDLCDRLGSTGDRGCKLDLGCDPGTESGLGTCQPRAMPGEPCERARTEAAGTCVYGSWCVFASADAASGSCGVPPMEPLTPCSWFAHGGAMFCPFGTYADTGSEPPETEVPKYCLCRPVLALGEACTDDQQCETMRCGAVGNHERCIARLSDGADCTGLEAYCASWCEADTSTCHVQCQSRPASDTR
jgi:hypothetical protein